jgi:hypothetical protein
VHPRPRHPDLRSLCRSVVTHHLITIHGDAAITIAGVHQHSAASARWIFRDALGDPTADELWSTAKERPGGLTRTEVSELFSRNKKRLEIERALSVLEEAGRLRRETRHAERGRSTEVWIPAPAPAA